MTPQHEFSRQAFFEMVWSEPMTKVAAKLGISDVAVKKICARHEIAVPGLGYWAKVAAGHKLQRPKLTAPSRPELEDVRIYGSPRNELKPEIRTAEQAAKAKEADRKITVPPTLENPHPVVRATLLRLKKAKPNEYGALVTYGPEFFRVSVSPSQLDRSIRILNALARASEERTFPVERGKESACLRVNGEPIEFRLREKIDRKPHEQTPAEAAKAAQERKRWPGLGESRPWWQPVWDWIPSGRLMLELEEFRHHGLRRLFRDGKRQRLEDQLNDFLAGVVAFAAAEKEWRDESEKRQREWREQEQRRIEQQQQIERNKKRWALLSDRIQALERAQRIDRFLEHVASNSSESDPLPKNVQSLIDWGKRYSVLLKSMCTASELDRVLAESELFVPQAMEADKWFDVR